MSISKSAKLSDIPDGPRDPRRRAGEHRKVEPEMIDLARELGREWSEMKKTNTITSENVAKRIRPLLDALAKRVAKQAARPGRKSRSRLRYDVLAVRLDDCRVEWIAGANLASLVEAEGARNYVVGRRGVETHFFPIVETGAYEVGSVWQGTTPSQ